MGISLLFDPATNWTNPSLSPNTPEWDWINPYMVYEKIFLVNLFVSLVVKFDHNRISVSVKLIFTSSGSEGFNNEIRSSFLYIQGASVYPIVVALVYVMFNRSIISSYVISILYTISSRTRDSDTLLFPILQEFHFQNHQSLLNNIHCFLFLFKYPSFQLLEHLVHYHLQVEALINLLLCQYIHRVISSKSSIILVCQLKNYCFQQLYWKQNWFLQILSLLIAICLLQIGVLGHRMQNCLFNLKSSVSSGFVFVCSIKKIGMFF